MTKLTAIYWSLSLIRGSYADILTRARFSLLRPSEFNALFLIARLTHAFAKEVKKSPESRIRYFNLQAHDLELLTPIVLNYH